ncbi:MAG: hypothetical protein MJZ11_03380 [Lachnospiraceae bacterium]|nr:hypothetical protein [Lachnospiraceae bacterium]
MAQGIESSMFNREVAFCRIYSKDAKEKLEKLFLNNRISYFIEWENRSFISKLLGSKEKNVFTIKINEEDVQRATELVKDMQSIKMRKKA